MTTRKEMADRRQRAAELNETWSSFFAGQPLSEVRLKDLTKLLAKHTADDVTAAMEIVAKSYIRYDKANGRPTPASIDFAFNKLGAVCYMRNLARENPDQHRLYAIRRDASNRCADFDDREAMVLLKEALLRGVGVEAMAMVASSTRGWEDFSQRISELEATPGRDAAASSAAASQDAPGAAPCAATDSGTMSAELTAASTIAAAAVMSGLQERRAKAESLKELWHQLAPAAEWHQGYIQRAFVLLGEFSLEELHDGLNSLAALHMTFTASGAVHPESAARAMEHLGAYCRAQRGDPMDPAMEPCLRLRAYARKKFPNISEAQARLLLAVILNAYKAGHPPERIKELILATSSLHQLAAELRTLSLQTSAAPAA